MMTRPPLITVKELRTLEQWEKITEYWDDLLERTPEASVFNSFTFLNHYSRCFLDPDKDRLAILILKDENGKIIGAAPMIRNKKWMAGFPVRVVSLIYDRNVMDRPQFLLPERRKEQLRAIFRFFRERPGEWDVIELKEQVLDQEYEEAFREAFKNRRKFSIETTPLSVDPFLKLNSEADAWEKYLARQSKNHRKKWRNRNNRLERLGKINLKRYTEPSEIGKALQKYRILEKKSRKWNQKAQIGESTYAFYQEISKHLAPKGALHILFLSVDGTPVAGHIGLSFKNRYAALQYVFDQAFESFSPGFLVGGHDLKWVMESDFTEYDFMSGFLADKRLWTSSCRMTHFIRIVRKDAWGGLFYLSKFRIVPYILSVLGQSRLDTRLKKLAGYEKPAEVNSKFSRHNCRLHNPDSKPQEVMLSLENANEFNPVVNHHVHVGKEIHHTINTMAFSMFRALRVTASNLDVKILEGSDKHGGHPVRAGYIGDGSNFHFMMELLFHKSPHIVRSCKTGWWNLNIMVEKISSNVDFAVLDLDFPLSLFVNLKDMVRIPRWVKQRVPVAGTWEKILAGLRRKTRKEALRLIRKFNFRACVISGSEGAGYFYEQLYRPHIFKRYGKSATVVSRERFIKECRHALIIQLFRENKVLGGVVVRLSKGQLSIVWIGMKTGLAEDEYQGVADALDLYTLLFAFQQGCRFLNMGGSRAFLNDGVLRYKKKWGAMIYRNKVPQGHLFILPVSYTPATASVLENNPWITHEKGGLAGNILLPEKFNPNELEKMVQYLWVDGLEKIRFFVRGRVPEGVRLDRKKAEIVTCPNGWFSKIQASELRLDKFVRIDP